MATNTPETPTRETRPQQAPLRGRDAPEAELRGTGARQSMRARMDDKYAEEADAWEREGEAARTRATVGIRDGDMLDRVLAMGGDVTRASPDPAQSLADAEPGFTTTTGAYRTPIDPTTAAVPAPANSPIAMKLRGTPTVGSEGPDQPEELWKERDITLDRDELDRRADEREKEVEQRAEERKQEREKNDNQNKNRTAQSSQHSPAHPTNAPPTRA